MVLEDPQGRGQAHQPMISWSVRNMGKPGHAGRSGAGPGNSRELITAPDNGKKISSGIWDIMTYKIMIRSI